MNVQRRLVLQLARLAPDQRWLAIRRLSEADRYDLMLEWRGWAHDGQVAPPGDWRAWLIRAGRGFGKTRAGAEWVCEIARTMPGVEIGLVAATASDGRRVMVEGESGVLAVSRVQGQAAWSPTAGSIRFASGATAHLYSAESPDSLRGPQHHYVWCDELAKWRRGEQAWANLLLGLRLGERPRVLVTTTPAPVPLMHTVMRMTGLVETRGRTGDNIHVAPSFAAEMEAQYGGTRFGRQELDGELLGDHEGALWTRATLDGCRADATPPLMRVAVAVDPPASAEGDECGIVAAGIDADGVAWVLEDASVGGLSPRGWGEAAAACAARHGADRVVVEANQGGDMATHVLRGVDPALPVRKVHASRGKVARAEPVAALYEQGRVRHLGAFPALEDQLAGLVVGGAYRGPGRSPDRADALVWALSELMLRPKGRAGVRGL